MIAVSRRSCTAPGWSIEQPGNIHYAAYMDFIARHADVALAIFCSGVDRPARVTDVRDLASAVRFTGLQTLLAHGEPLDPRVRAAASQCNVSIIGRREAADLTQLLKIIRPRVSGCLDYVAGNGEIGGWARLSPTPDKAVLRIEIGEVLVGTIVADLYRADLAKFGDGRYAFRYDTGMTGITDAVARTVRLGVMYGDVLVGSVGPSAATRLPDAD